MSYDEVTVQSVENNNFDKVEFFLKLFLITVYDYYKQNYCYFLITIIIVVVIMSGTETHYQTTFIVDNNYLYF